MDSIYYPRSISSSIRENTSKFPILAVTGPRQSGKTTLLKNLFPDYTYVSLEDQDNRDLATNDPRFFLTKFDRNVIFDEVQRTPELFSYMQTVVDASGEMGQFIISGSQNFHLMEKISQSLAGRVGIFRLLPLDSTELPRGTDKQDWNKRIIEGFYPSVYQRGIRPEVFYESYIKTYIERDIRALANVHDMGLFTKFISLCAGRVGQVINFSNLANECGITQPTAKSWLSILELSYIVFLLPPYFENFNKRVTKSPKLYFYDSGLAAFLLGLRKGDDLTQTRLRGNLFENLVIADIIKKNHHLYQFKKFYFWRDQHNFEVDLLNPKAMEFDIFEIKATHTIQNKLFAGMDKFDTLTKDRVKKKTLIYGGSESQDRTNYAIRPWYDVG